MTRILLRSAAVAAFLLPVPAFAKPAPLPLAAASVNGLAAQPREELQLAQKRGQMPARGSSAELYGGSSADRYGGSSADRGGVAGPRDPRHSRPSEEKRRIAQREERREREQRRAREEQEQREQDE